MLQPYDWNVPTNYHRLTQKSFAVVIAKLDTIYYSRKLAELDAEDFARRISNSRAAKLNAEILGLSATKETLSDSSHSNYYITAKTASLNADMIRLMAVRNSMQWSYTGSDRQSEKSEPRAPLATTSTEIVSVKPDASTSFIKIRLFALVALLVAAGVWTMRRAGPVQFGQLAGKLIETLAHVLVVAFGIAWGIGKLIATGLQIVGRTGRYLGWMVYCECRVGVSRHVSLYRTQEDWECTSRPG